MSSPCASLGFADYELVAVAEAAAISSALEAVPPRQFPRLVVGMLSNGEAQTFCDAVVADRLRRKARNERPDLVEDCHVAAAVRDA